MGFLAGSSRGSWRPELTADTTTTSYWLNWRAVLCLFWLLLAMLFASFLISRYEGPRNFRIRQERRGDDDDDHVEEPGILYEDEVWKPCLKGMHPAWLLAYRTLAFFVLLILLILNVTFDGADIMYYYTQWTFTLVTIYFGLGSLLSMYGCFEYHNKVGSNGVGSEWIDAEHGNIPALAVGVPKSFYVQASRRRLHPPRKIAGFWAYVFQIIFQMNAGAVVLTDCVFWFIILPFLATKNYDINFLIVNMHTINAVFLLGDTAMNCLEQIVEFEFHLRTLAVPMVPNRLLLPLDILLRGLPMDPSCLHIPLVAVSVPGLVEEPSSVMVLFGWDNALPLLRPLRLGDQDEALVAVKVLS